MAPPLTVSDTAHPVWPQAGASMLPFQGRGVTVSAQSTPAFAPPMPWGNHVPSPFGSSSGSQSWSQTNSTGSTIAWPQSAPMGNHFQQSPLPGIGVMMGGQQSMTPVRLPPKPPIKEEPPVMNAFMALDPFGEKEKKTGKDMFKDFQMVRPPSTSTGKTEPASTPKLSPGGDEAFAQYFTNKIGVPQEVADHDDFDITQISSSLSGTHQLFFICLSSHNTVSIFLNDALK